MIWLRVSIENDGSFSSTTGVNVGGDAVQGDIDGVFYGTGGTEVGGTFNRSGIIGCIRREEVITKTPTSIYSTIRNPVVPCRSAFPLASALIS